MNLPGDLAVLDQQAKGKIISMKQKYSLVFIFLLAFYGVFGQGKGGNRDYQYALIEAVKQKNLGNIPGAIELYRMVLNANDSVAVAHFELGSLLALTGKKEEAKEHLEKAYSFDKNNKWYFQGLIDVLLANKDYKSAADLIKKKIDKDDDGVIYSFLLANVYFNQGKDRKALKILDKIEKNYGLSDKIILLKGSIYEKEGKYKRALDEVERIISAFPESVDYKIVAAELAGKSGNRALSSEYYKDVLVIDSSNVYAITNLTDYYREKGDVKQSLYYLNSSFKNKEIDYSKKMAILGYYLSNKKYSSAYSNELQNLIETMLTQYKDQEEIHLFATDFYIQRKNFSRALESLLPVLDNNQNRYEVWKQGILLANATGSDSVLNDLCKNAEKIFTDSTEIKFYKGMAEYNLEKYDEVISTFSSVFFASCTNEQIVEQANIVLAESLNSLKRYDEADSLFREIIKRYPENDLVKNNFAYYFSLRDTCLSEAKSISFMTVEKNPTNYTYLDTYAWILYKMKQYSDAETFISDALKNGGEEDPDVLEHAADIYFATGNKDIAKKYYQKAITLGGDKESIERKIGKLEEVEKQ